MLRSTIVRKRDRAFTLVELIVVIAVLGAMVIFGAGISSNVLTAVRLKGSFEELMWDMRAAQQYAIARGNFPPPTSVTCGVKFFTNRVNANHNGPESGPGTGCSYVIWGADMRKFPQIVQPTDASIQANTAYLPYVVNMPVGVMLAKTGGTLLNGTESIVFTQNGDVVPGALGLGAGTAISLIAQFPAPPGVADVGPFTITIWGEDTNAAGIPERPKSIMMQGPP